MDDRFLAAVEAVFRRVLHTTDGADGLSGGRPRPEVRRLYDVPSAAAQLSVSPAKAWVLIKEGRLRAVKVDGRTLIRATELDRFAAEEVRTE